MTEEHSTVPPETAGIQAQPSQAELEAIAQKYQQEKKEFPIPVIAVIVGVVLLAIGGLVFMLLQQQRQAQQAVIPEVMIEPEETPMATTSATQRDLSFEDRLFDGSTKVVYPALSTESFDTNWKDRGLSYTLVGLSDYGQLDSKLGSSRGVPVRYLDHKVLVVEIAVRDTRITGEPVPIKAEEYVAIRFDKTEFDAADWREIELSPGETATVFVPFILPLDAEDYFVLSGDLRNPFLSPVGAPDAALPVIVE